MLIHVYGTSHVSQDSIDLIQEKIEEHDPDIVGVELDLRRLQALTSDESGTADTVLGELIRRFQNYVGGKTGVMPGEEMLYAYETAVGRGSDVALIDRDIGKTLKRLKKVSRKEKVRAVFSVILSVFAGSKFDLERIPDTETVDGILQEFEEEFPGMYRVLIEERDRHMAEALRGVEAENPEAEIVAFVGAGHCAEVKRLLDEIDRESGVEPGFDA